MPEPTPLFYVTLARVDISIVQYMHSKIEQHCQRRSFLSDPHSNDYISRAELWTRRIGSAILRAQTDNRLAKVMRAILYDPVAAITLMRHSEIMYST